MSEANNVPTLDDGVANLEGVTRVKESLKESDTECSVYEDDGVVDESLCENESSFFDSSAQTSRGSAAGEVSTRTNDFRKTSGSPKLKVAPPKKARYCTSSQTQNCLISKMFRNSASVNNVTSSELVETITSCDRGGFSEDVVVPRLPFQREVVDKSSNRTNNSVKIEFDQILLDDSNAQSETITTESFVTENDVNKLPTTCNVNTYVKSDTDACDATSCGDDVIGSKSEITDLNCNRNILNSVDASTVTARSITDCTEDEVLCEKCDRRVSAWEMPEHLDYHFALELQKQEPGATTASRSFVLPKNGGSSSRSVKRKSGEIGNSVKKSQSDRLKVTKLDTYFQKNNQ